MMKATCHLSRMLNFAPVATPPPLKTSGARSVRKWNRVAWLPILISVLFEGGLASQAAAPSEPETLHRVRSAFLEAGFEPAALEGMRVTDQIHSPHNGITHCYVQQIYHGRDIEQACATLSFDANDQLVSFRHRFRGKLPEARAQRRTPCTPGTALAQAAKALGLKPPPDPEPLEQDPGPRAATVLAGGKTSGAPVPAELVYMSDESGELQLAWKLTVQAPDGAQVWDVLVDAFDESVRRVHDQIRHAAYRAYPLPLESPDEGPSALVVDPADPMFSPFGWHDTNGQPGAEYLNTRGNNASVVEDRDGNNGVGSSPHGGADLVFDFPPDPADGTDFRPAAVNAFYWVNLMHDIHCRFGFDEASGNFQQIHYAGSSSGAGDAVLVDVQDSSKQNGAFMYTPADGTSPRMVFHLFEFARVEILPPSPIAGTIWAGTAKFGISLRQGAVTGRVVHALNAVDPGSPCTNLTACTTLCNPEELAGNIALIERGSCRFVDKVKRAQTAGAIAVIVYDDGRGDEMYLMGGEDPTIVIPSVFVGQSAGHQIRVALDDRVDVILSPVSRDPAFDNGVVIHEFGHGVTTRLTGGASVNNCLNQAQSTGLAEGWSDWWGLVFTVQPEDAPTLARTFGTFSLPVGFRAYPYSTDTAANPLTYGDIQGMDPEKEHDIGEIWCATLWELYWNLVAMHGYSPDFEPGPAGNQVALQLITDGLKFQPCNPTFLEARDAILMADEVNNQGANRWLIWNAFAKRGMGLSADDGGSADSIAVTESFDLPPDLRIPRFMAARSAAAPSFSWRSVYDGTYRLEATDTLGSTEWETIDDAIDSEGVITSFPLSDPPESTQFYRVLLVPPQPAGTGL